MKQFQNMRNINKSQNNSTQLDWETAGVIMYFILSLDTVRYHYTVHACYGYTDVHVHTTYIYTHMAFHMLDIQGLPDF